MGARGPRPETPEIQALKGNPGKRARRAPSIKASGAATTPKHLVGDAKECFEAIRGAMPPGTYATTDVQAIAIYAVAWADHKRATEALATEAAIVAGSTGNLQPNPWFKIRNEAARIMMSMGDRLGLDPKARAAIAQPGDDKPKSKFAGLIGGRGE